MSVYAELAKKNNVTFLPFLLQGVAGVDTLNQGGPGASESARGGDHRGDGVGDAPGDAGAEREDAALDRRLRQTP